MNTAKPFWITYHACVCMPDKILDEQIDSQQQELDSNNKQYWMPDKMCKVR
jgi:hypothetical protein